MTAKELKSAQDSEVIVDYIRTYAGFVFNLNTGGGIKQYGKHLKDLDAEMLRRGILTEEQVKLLNS